MPLPDAQTPAAVDAVVVGSGPNGLAAAAVLAEAGRSVTVLEANDTVGGGVRTEALTRPGFLHDVCSAVHPLGIASPVFERLGLEEEGLEWVHPEVPLAHPLDPVPGGAPRAVALYRDLARTADGLAATADGRGDGRAWQRTVGWVGERSRFDRLKRDLLAPFHLPGSPRAGWELARFGVQALRPAVGFCDGTFSGERARALFAGIAAHSVLPLERLTSAAVALVLGGAAHAVGWPSPRGGSAQIASALVARLERLGGTVVTGHRVRSLADLPPAAAYLFDVTPRQLVEIAGSELPAGYRRRLERYRYGPGVFTLDWALSEPIPWGAEVCGRAGTVHLGGTLEEIAAAEAAVWRGEHPERPYVLLGQQSIADPSRAPAGQHTAWAYCHVPHGSTVDRTRAIEDQVERFAPGFRDVVLERVTRNSAELEAGNANLVGGDIGGGVLDLGQLFTRPVARRVPYATPHPRLWLCSSSTPPGGGVHGMCGDHAARSLLARWPAL